MPPQSLITTDQIRSILRDFYIQKLDFDLREGAGLLSDIFPNTFTPSVGHPEAIYAINESDIPRLNCIIQDYCFRSIDLNRVGYGPHLSLFQMSVSLRISEFSRVNCELEIRNAFAALEAIPGFNKSQLYVTVFPGATFFGKEIKPDDWSFSLWSSLGIPEENIVQAPGDACILVPGSGNEPGGVRSEIFYKPFDRDAFEIATIEFLEYKLVAGKGRRILVELPKGVGLFATAFGIERLAILANKYKSIFEVEELSALTNQIVEYVDFRSFYSVQPQIFNNLADAYRSARAIFESGQEINNTRRGQILKTVIMKINRLCKELGISAQDLICHLIKSDERKQDWANRFLSAFT